MKPYRIKEKRQGLIFLQADHTWSVPTGSELNWGLLGILLCALLFFKKLQKSR